MTQDRAQLLITAVDQTRSAFDSIRGNLAKLGDESNRVKGLLAGLGVSLSVAGFAAMIKNAIDAADHLNKLSQKIGISVEALSTLRFAAQLSDVSLETLQKGIKGLSQNITEANTGIGDGAQVFEALGDLRQERRRQHEVHRGGAAAGGRCLRQPGGRRGQDGAGRQAVRQERHGHDPVPEPGGGGHHVN